MTTSEVLRELEKAGTAQNRKIYARHGITAPMYGVSYASLGKIAKRVGKSQELAEALWESGNHDARILATMIAEPDRITAGTVDKWAREMDDYVVTGAVATVVARSRFARSRAETWMSSRREWMATAGWSILSGLAQRGKMTAAELAPYISRIETSIHRARNRVRYAMNGALIGIGTVNATLEKQAIAAAKRIGPVEVDHGETGCKTPDAVTYIPKAAAHRRKKAAKSSGPKARPARSRA